MSIGRISSYLVDIEMFFVEKSCLPMPAGWLPDNAARRWEVMLLNRKNKAQETFGYFARKEQSEPKLEMLLEHLFSESLHQESTEKEIIECFGCCCEFKAKKIMDRLNRNSIKLKRLFGEDFDRMRDLFLAELDLVEDLYQQYSLSFLS